MNGDESEPGTFKDRMLLEHDPHQLLEGALLCAYAVGAGCVLVYVRGEAALAYDRVPMLSPTRVAMVWSAATSSVPPSRAT